LIKQLCARIVVEGESFRFGRNRAGDLEYLQSLGSSQG
jgi:FAD synthase